MYIRRRRGWEIPESAATPGGLYFPRRGLMGAGAMLAAHYWVVRRTNRVVREPEQDFYAPFDNNHAVIVALNEAGDWPAGDPVELEAGANRCAVG